MPYPRPEGDHLVIAVDLGKTKLGVARGYVPDSGSPILEWAKTIRCAAGAPPELVAGRVHHEALPLAWTGPTIWVCEWPVKYPDTSKFHEDLSDLHAVGNALAALNGGWNQAYFPTHWKGQVPKKAHQKRLYRALSTEERAVMPSFREHDAWDAAGIWLYATGRTRRGGVL